MLNLFVRKKLLRDYVHVMALFFNEKLNAGDIRLLNE
jgi:hypothetical protein